MMEKWLNLIRGLTRPLVTLGVVGTLMALMVRIFWHATVPPLTAPSLPVEVYIALISSFTTTVGLIIAFWFGSRANRPVSP